MKKLLSIAIVAILGLSSVYAGELKLPKKKQTPQKKYLSASQAYEAITKRGKDILFVDVRERAELEFVGSTGLAINIPYTIKAWDEWDEKKKTRFKWELNGDFLARIKSALKAKGLNKNSQIILMCRSGSRSAKAAGLLSKAGYNNVYTVWDGFEGDKSKHKIKGHVVKIRDKNGWKNSNLPWTYKLKKENMYFED